MVLNELCGYIEDHYYKDFICSCLVEPNDFIRIHIINSLIVVKNHPKPENFADFIENIVVKLGSDESWRVRFSLCEKIDELLNLPNLKVSTKNKIIEIYGQMFNDVEAEIRNLCCINLENMAENFGKEEVFVNVLKQLNKIEKDSACYVRSSLASTILRICPLIGKQNTSEYIFPVFLNLIKDETHEIRLTLIKSLDRLNEVVSVDVILPKVIPSITEISSNKSWRVRIQIMESLPVMARIMVYLILFIKE
jgi:serine/threonine-protein phosphatase 2A regulatory subunit A